DALELSVGGTESLDDPVCVEWIWSPYLPWRGGLIQPVSSLTRRFLLFSRRSRGKAAHPAIAAAVFVAELSIAAVAGALAYFHKTTETLLVLGVSGLVAAYAFCRGPGRARTLSKGELPISNSTMTLNQ